MLGVDMSSTGEVGCLGDDSSDALLKAMLSVGNRIPSKEYSSTGGPKQKAAMLDAAHKLNNKGLQDLRHRRHTRLHQRQRHTRRKGLLAQSGRHAAAGTRTAPQP